MKTKTMNTKFSCEFVEHQQVICTLRLRARRGQDEGDVAMFQVTQVWHHEDGTAAEVGALPP